MLFLEGEPFTTGSQPYLFRPALPSDSSKRIIIEIEIHGRRTQAMLDTGAPYLICEPDIAKTLDIDPDACLQKERLAIRNQLIDGRLHRLDLTITAEEGERLIIDATVFVPDSTVDSWPGLPSIVGLEGCLERVRFAFDTSSETFYFGPHP
jgi:hypothetical protein